MTWTCPNCDRDYPDSTIGVPREYDADDKDGCMVCFISPVGTSTFEDPGDRTDDWPKEWGDIRPDTSSNPRTIHTSATFVNLGPIRLYDGTVYIQPDAAWEGDNRDGWMPLGVYLHER